MGSNPTGLVFAPDSQYEAQGMTPLESALSKRRKKLAATEIGEVSQEDKERLGLIDG